MVGSGNGRTVSPPSGASLSSSSSMCRSSSSLASFSFIGIPPCRPPCHKSTYLMHRGHLDVKKKFLWSLGIDPRREEMFGPADKAANRRRCYNIRIGEIGIAFAHAAGHIAVRGGNGYLSLLRTARAGIDTGPAARFFNHMNACLE